MRRVETDISNAFEISAMQGLVDGMREGRRFIKRGIEAHDVLNPEDLAEALDALKLTLKEKAGPQVPLKVWDKAMEKFETDVRKPLEADLASRPAIPVLQSPPLPAQAPTTPTSAQYNYGATPPQPTGSRSPRPLPQAPAQDPFTGHPHQPQTVTPPMTPGSSGGFFGSATPPAVSQYASSSYNQPYANVGATSTPCLWFFATRVYATAVWCFSAWRACATPQQQYGTSPPGGYAQPYPGQPQQPYYGGYQNSAPTQQPQQPYSAYANPSSTQPYTGYQNPSPTQPQQPYSYPTSSPPQQAQQLYDHQGTPLPQPPHNFVSHLPVASTLSHGNKSNFFSTASRAPAVPQKDPRRIVRQHGDAGRIGGNLM
ncbi:hypothetical protein BC829DRAFT_402870 [Chytridium lagenaria]|nr:hypothetical protein BC829DRAFT_402870 [Chytridium lagenaria]